MQLVVGEKVIAAGLWCYYTVEVRELLFWPDPLGNAGWLSESNGSLSCPWTKDSGTCETMCKYVYTLNIP